MIRRNMVLVKKMLMSVAILLMLTVAPAYAAQWVSWPAPEAANGEQPRFARYFDRDTVRILYKDGDIQSIYFWCKNIPVNESKLDYLITLNCINIHHEGGETVNTAEYFSPFFMRSKEGQSLENNHDQWTFFGENNGTTLKGMDKIFEELKADTEQEKLARIINTPLDVQNEQVPQSVFSE